jgi:hypothetical protein
LFEYRLSDRFYFTIFAHVVSFLEGLHSKDTAKKQNFTEVTCFFSDK